MADDQARAMNVSRDVVRPAIRRIDLAASLAARRLHPGRAGNAALDRLTALAARLLAAPSSLVSLVDDVASVVGRTGVPAAVRADVPLSESLCAVCVADGRPVSIPDTRVDPRSATVSAVRDGLVGSFLGVPLTSDSGVVVGALCVFGPDPHVWTAEDAATLQALAASAVAELELAALARDFDLSRSRWDLAIESAGLGSFDWDLRTGRLAWDQTLVDLFGYGGDERFDESIDSFTARLHPDDAPRVAAALQHAIDTVGDYEADYRVVLPDGQVRDVQARGRAVGTGDSTERVLGAAWDVSATRHAERRAAQVIEAMPAGYLALDRDHQIRATNRESERLLGETRTALIGSTLESRMSRRAAAAFVAACTAVDDTGDPVGMELQILTEPPTWFDVRVWPGRNGVSVFFADITARVHAAAIETAAAAHARTVATTLQNALQTDLPHHAELELAGRYLPASTTEKVGGDWYDAVVRPDGTTTVMIGDVVGHDIEAAATMGQLRSMLRAFAWETDQPPSTILTRLDRVTHDLHPGVLATAIVARVERTGAHHDDETHLLQWTDAGHPPPLVLHADGRVEVLDGFDLMLGVDPRIPRSDHVAPLPSGCTVLLYTDGLVETRNTDIDTGIDRLQDALRRHRHLGLDDMLDQVITELVGSSPEDDVAVVAVRFRHAPRW